MSYCVNCGVELEASLKECPLCNTIVINPNELPNSKAGSAFPTGKGQVEVVKRKDIGILVTIILSVLAISCSVLNWLVFDGYPWSLLIVGVCAVLWVMILPIVFHTGQSVYTSLLLDGAAIAVYLYVISFLTPSHEWFWGLGLWIIVLTTAVAEAFTFCIRVFPRSFLTDALYCITSISVFCVGLECMIDYRLYDRVFIRWSAIVLVICVVLDVTLIALLSIRRLREEVRRRFHF